MKELAAVREPNSVATFKAALKTHLSHVTLKTLLLQQQGLFNDKHYLIYFNMFTNFDQVLQGYMVHYKCLFYNLLQRDLYIY